MTRKSYTIEQIFNKLQEAEVLLGQRQRVGDICRSFSISFSILWVVRHAVASLTP
jgi:hypothetical protein